MAPPGDLSPLTPRDRLERARSPQRRMRTRVIFTAQRVAICISLLGTLQVATAQPATTRSLKARDFAWVVPNTAGFFLTINKPLETDRAMRRANAWPFVSLLAGQNTPQAGNRGLRDAVAAFIGPNTTINPDDLLQAEVGFAGKAWNEIGGAVWLMRLQDVAKLDVWFPHEARTVPSKARQLKSFRTMDGLRALYANDVLVMGRRVGRDSMLRQCALLMLDRGKDSLRRDPGYQKLVGYLPARALATAYFGTPSAGSDSEASFPFLPDLQQAVVGLYERPGRFEFAVRALRSNPVNEQKIALGTFTRLMQLPQDTMFAVATTLAPDTMRDLAGSVIDRIVPRLILKGESHNSPDVGFDLLEPQVVVAVEQAVAMPHASPQMALLIRSGDTRAAAAAIGTQVDRFLKALRVIDPVADTDAPAIHRESHLGVPIQSVPLTSYVDASRFHSLEVFRNYEPAWAAWGDWLVLALHKDHIKRIVDAKYGLTPRLEDKADMQRLNYYAAERSTIAILQPDIMSEVIAQWLIRFDGGRASLLDTQWWESPDVDDAFLLTHLGIELEEDFRPGVVSVGAVVDGSAAHGSLQSGDQIVGVGGVVLDVDFPEASLRRIFQRNPRTDLRMFRVLRNGEMLDLHLDRLPKTAESSPAAPAPDRALRRLLAVLRTLENAEFVVHSTRDREYSAKLTVSFAKP